MLSSDGEDDTDSSRIDSRSNLVAEFLREARCNDGHTVAISKVELLIQSLLSDHNSTSCKNMEASVGPSIESSVGSKVLHVNKADLDSSLDGGTIRVPVDNDRLLSVVNLLLNKLLSGSVSSRLGWAGRICSLHS